jgi:transposase InsO family protein
MDTSTRLLELAAQDDPSSAEAARIVDQVWFNRYPRPRRCIYDGGAEFKLEFQELLESYGIEKAPITARNPQANSTIERVHRCINENLRSEEITTKEDWENCLSSVAYGLRASHHTMMGCSPAQAAFGRDMLFDS